MFCPHCGKEVNEGQTFCHHCGARIAQLSGPADTVRTGPAWEDRENRGFFRALGATIRESLFAPTEFFRTMKVAGGFSDPLLYAIITGMTGIMLSFFWQAILRDQLQTFLPQDVQAVDTIGTAGMAVLAVFTPFFLVMGLFVWAGGLHLLLLMVRGAKNGFEATFRVAAYSAGSLLFLVLPFCGGLFAVISSLVVTIIGLKGAHGIGGGKAAFAVFFPLILCCALSVLAVAMFISAVAASLGALSH
ncbi:MAG: YIP1 family protein [Nitrospiraceae bacterium]|nr:YIP1 family protein [Nitrospiraceae bacterium]